MSEEDQKLFRLYGKLPSKRDFLQKKLEVCSSYHKNEWSDHRIRIRRVVSC